MTHEDSSEASPLDDSRSECIDTDISGDNPHPAVQGTDRCEFHRTQYSKFLATNRQRRRRGSAKAPLRWVDVVRKRPAHQLPLELTKQQVDSIRENAAAVATEKASLDSTILYGGRKFDIADVRGFLLAVNDLLDALRVVIAPGSRGPK